MPRSKFSAGRQFSTTKSASSPSANTLYAILEMTRKTIKILVITFLLIASTGFGYLKMTYFFEIDSCLDKGGRWNYEKQICELDNNMHVDTLPTVSTDKQQLDIYIKDKSQFDQTFINGLADYNEPVKLIDNYIIAGKDTTYFPNDLSLNKATTFKATKNNNKFVLTVTRTNLTNLIYSYQLLDKDNKTIDTKSGKAILGSMFFLASEVDEDDLTGTAYGSCEYWDKANDCWLAIRIGIGKDDNGKLRAMLNYGCNDKSIQTLNLDECPTLRTE